MSDDQSPSVFAQYAWAFWTCPIGAALVSAAFAYPIECTTETGLSLPFRTSVTDACTNIFGTEAATPSQETAALIAVAAGAISFFVVWLIASAASSRSAQ